MCTISTLYFVNRLKFAISYINRQPRFNYVLIIIIIFVSIKFRIPTIWLKYVFTIYRYYSVLFSFFTAIIVLCILRNIIIIIDLSQPMCVSILLWFLWIIVRRGTYVGRWLFIRLSVVPIYILCNGIKQLCDRN